MQPYANRAGDSGILAFEVDDDSITVQFADGGTYLYTAASAGRDNILEMHRLARTGRGLATFINQHVRDRFARQLA